MTSESMALPDIDIPRSSAYEANERRYGVDTDRCLICAKPVDLSRARVVVLEAGLGMITAPPAGDSEGTGGCFYIGPDCWRRHPQIHPYELK
jgi:hypothetical protein